MLKKIGIVLLTMLIVSPTNNVIVFADTINNEEVSVHEASAGVYVLGPNSTAYHEIKGPTIGIANLSTSPGPITASIPISSGVTIDFIISPEQTFITMVNFSTDKITIKTGSAAGMYRYQIE